MVAARSIPHHLEGEPLLIISGLLLVHPRLLAVLVLPPLGPTALLSLTVAGIGVIRVNCSNVVGPISEVLPVISSLAPEIRAINPSGGTGTFIAEMPPTRFNRGKPRLCRIS